MFRALVVNNDNLEGVLLDEVCAIKSIAWPYSLEMQRDWIKKNLTSNDLHFLVYNDDILIAYMNLVMVKFKINELEIAAFGVGNVCAIEKGKGYGAVLMNYANEYMLNSNSIGLLFCNTSLVDFYARYDWKVIPKSKISFPLVNETNFETMILNYTNPISAVIYADRLF